jgi:serine protease AprX
MEVLEAAVPSAAIARPIVVEFTGAAVREEAISPRLVEQVTSQLSKSLHEASKTLGQRLFAPEVVRRAQIRSVREEFLKQAGPLWGEIERSTRGLAPAALEASWLQSASTAEVCWLNRTLRAWTDPRLLVEVAGDKKIRLLDLPRRLHAEVHETATVVGAPYYRSTKGATGKDVILAVIDSEVDLRHPGLKDRVVHKHNFTREPWGTPGDHGTAVAGIAASSDATFTGMAPEATIYNYKVIATNRELNSDDFGGALAIQQALEDGAHVANCSWGAGTVTEEVSREARACDQAWALGLVVVKSAGNQGPGRSTVTRPAEASGIIVVGATDHSGVSIQDYSSRGPLPSGIHRPHLVAPGGSDSRGIFSCQVGGGYGDCGMGTSYAAPHVSGLVAQLLDENPDLTPAQVRSKLLATCASLGGYDQNMQGDGLVSLVRA